MGQVIAVIQLVEALISLVQMAQSDGTVAAVEGDIQGAIAALAAEMAKPETQSALEGVKKLFGGK